jgi:hypothetical protein
MVGRIEMARKGADLGGELVNRVHGHVLVRGWLCVQSTLRVLNVHAHFSVVRPQTDAAKSDNTLRKCRVRRIRDRAYMGA